MGEGEGIDDEAGDQRGLRRQSKAQAENNANESVARVRRLWRRRRVEEEEWHMNNGFWGRRPTLPKARYYVTLHSALSGGIPQPTATTASDRPTNAAAVSLLFFPQMTLVVREKMKRRRRLCRIASRGGRQE